MYLNPFPFGLFVGVVSTIVLEVVALIIFGVTKGNKKR